MPQIDPNVALIRAEQLKLQVDSFNQVTVELQDRRVRCSGHIFRILDLFAKPTSFREAVARLSDHAAGAQDWIQLTADIQLLIQNGMLHEESKRPILLPAGHHFNTVSVHAAMLNDKTRTLNYIQALREQVRPGAVVVDIGTGSGVLAVAAAQAGAEHVYAIDQGMIGEIAHQVFAVNGFSDRITFLRGASSQLELPQKADVMVSEIIGNEPLSEGILATTKDAARRFMKLGAIYIPRQIAIYAVAVRLSDEKFPLTLISDQTLAHWYDWYKIDFSPLKAAQPDPLTFTLLPQNLTPHQLMSEVVCLSQIDLTDIRGLDVDACMETIAVQSGQIDGIFVFFETQLSDSVRLSTSPAVSDATNHWSQTVWMLDKPLQVNAGTRFSITYQFNQATGNSAAHVTAALKTD